MTANAEQLAREIAEEILAGDRHMMHSQIHRIKEIIAAKLKPLVEDAERSLSRIVKSQIPLEVLAVTIQERPYAELASQLQKMIVDECVANREFIAARKRGPQ